MKVCPYCAEELADDVVVCTHCGRDISVEPEWRRDPAPARAPTAEEIVRSSSAPAADAGLVARRGMNGLAIVAFLAAIGAGIFGTAAAFPTALGLIVHAAVVVLGLAAMRRTRARPAEGSGYGFAVAAVVLGAIGLIGYGRALIP